MSAETDNAYLVGLRLEGALQAGVTATDLVLYLTQFLRAQGVVGSFVEFFGSGMERLSLPDRATIANMAPEYGATMGFFPTDRETLRYLQLSGRDPHHIALVEQYCQSQSLFYSPDAPEPGYSAISHAASGSIQWRRSTTRAVIVSW